MAISTINVPQAVTYPGAILQVVNNTVQTNTTYFSTASTSFVSTGFSLTITPKSATSKILLLNTAVIDSPNTNLTAGTTIYRNGVNLATGTANSCLGVLRLAGTYADANLTMHFMDSPATTSALTYTVYAYASSATMYYGINGGNAGSNVLSFTAMEIAA